MEKYLQHVEYHKSTMTEEMTRKVYLDYIFLEPSSIESATWYKFIGTNGQMSFGRILSLDIKDNLVEIKPFNKPNDPCWTYIVPEKGTIFFGNPITTADFGIVSNLDHLQVA